jgi:signal transduction histidine kinase
MDSMFESRGRRRIRTNSLMAICAIAILAPTSILFWLQYRSLDQLRAKTRIAVQDDVRQKLEALRQDLENRVTTAASDSLRQFDMRDLLQEHLVATGAKFRSILDKYPAVQRIIVVSECNCRGEPYLIASQGRTAEWVKCARFIEPDFADSLSAHRAARSIPGRNQDKDLLYFQSGLRPVLYVSRYLPGANAREGASYVMLAVASDSLIREVASKPGELALAVTENGRGVIFGGESSRTGFDASIHGGAMFPLWTLEARLKGATIESLAKDQFRNSLLLAGAVLCCLILAIALSLRAVTREAKLAELKSGFVSNVSHEMKTPLSLIRVFAETLDLGRVTDPAKLREYYRVIHNESRRLTQLIENVLDFARMEAGRKEYQFAAADLSQIVADVLKPYEDHIRSSGFSLHVELQESLPPVLVDREAVSQAVLNLVDNALKYSTDRKHLGIRVWNRKDEVAIEVADHGIGIPEPEQRRIFEKFYRLNTGLVHDTKGSGLGLTLTNHIVEAHGGRIEVDSRAGGGSRFTIILPISSPGCEPLARQALPGEPLAQASHH